MLSSALHVMAFCANRIAKQKQKKMLILQLDLAKQLMLTKENGSRADVIKFRSRWNAGSPNIHPAKTHPPKWDEDQGVNMVSKKKKKMNTFWALC